MKKYVNLAALLFIALLPLVGSVACQSLKPALVQSVATAQKVSDDAQVILTNAKALATTLPISSAELATVTADIAKVQAIKDQADKYVAQANAALTAGTISPLDPTATGALSLLPYGSYIVAAVGIGAAVYSRAKQNGTLSDLSKVVASWEAVGAELSPAEKAAVATIQGPKTSAVVDAVKQTL